MKYFWVNLILVNMLNYIENKKNLQVNYQPITDFYHKDDHNDIQTPFSSLNVPNSLIIDKIEPRINNPSNLNNSIGPTFTNKSFLPLEPSHTIAMHETNFYSNLQIHPEITFITPIYISPDGSPILEKFNPHYDKSISFIPNDVRLENYKTPTIINRDGSIIISEGTKSNIVPHKTKDLEPGEIFYAENFNKTELSSSLESNLNESALMFNYNVPNSTEENLINETDNDNTTEIINKNLSGNKTDQNNSSANSTTDDTDEDEDINVEGNKNVTQENETGFTDSNNTDLSKIKNNKEIEESDEKSEKELNNNNNKNSIVYLEEEKNLKKESDEQESPKDKESIEKQIKKLKIKLFGDPNTNMSLYQKNKHLYSKNSLKRSNTISEILSLEEHLEKLNQKAQ